MGWSMLKGRRRGNVISYEESKRLAQDRDGAKRMDLARREDARPEVLYHLASDPLPAVRSRIAANLSTPRQADLILSHDDDESVRSQLAMKIASLVPQFETGMQEQAQRYVVEVIEVLAKDQAVRVRQILAETLKDVAATPTHVIQQLARDAEEIVACPVLEFSPLLSDQDLLEIIENGCVTGKLQAISRRHALGERVSDALVTADDEQAITMLLANKTAQIREETLDCLVDVAPKVSAWHEPFVKRPKLSIRAVRKLAAFVAESLLNVLEQREDLDNETAKVVAKEMRRRLKDEKTAPAKDAIAETTETTETTKTDDAVAKEAKRLLDAGELDDEALSEALYEGKRDLVRHGLALRAKVTVGVVDRIMDARSAKGITSLAWKAECSMHFASQLQFQMGGIPPAQALYGRDGSEFPLSTEEMDWQIDFYQSLPG